MLLGATFFCCLVGYSLASAGATLVGQEVGCANITAAKYYYRSMLIVQILLTIALCMGLQILMGFFLDAVTDDVNMQDTILTVYQLWIFNIFLDNIRAMLKGFLRGLGIQNSVLPYHILVQGGCMPGGIFVLCFNLPAFEEVPILGAWISSSGCNFLLFVAYFTTIQRANWHEIGVKVVKRVNAIAGNRADDEEDFLDDGEAAGEIEMHKGLQ
jgi:Na+-driven multidrug efflux pump